MSLPAVLQEILAQNSGVITTAQANRAGVSNERLRLLAAAGELERVAHGVYIAPGEYIDKMYIAQLKRPKIIYSHETALFLHDLTDLNPDNYTVTVPTGYSAVRLRDDGLTVFTIKRELHEMGKSKAETLFGHTVIVYGPERTICDCIRNRNQLDAAVVTDAIKRYARRGNKNLNTLMDIADALRVTKLLKNYLDVLL